MERIYTTSFKKPGTRLPSNITRYGLAILASYAPAGRYAKCEGDFYASMVVFLQCINAQITFLCNKHDFRMQHEMFIFAYTIKIQISDIFNLISNLYKVKL